MAWTFYCYVGPEGKDVVADWIKGEPAGTRARLQAALDALVGELEKVDRDQFTRQDGVGQLRWNCSGFFELLLYVDKVQYRPIGVYGPGQREFTLLSVDKEKGNELVEDPDCKRPERRRKNISNRRNIREYFSKGNHR